MSVAKGDYKYCPGCREFHPVECFGRNARQSDGLQVFCRHARSNAQKRQRAEKPEIIYNISTDYASRGSVPHEQRLLFEEVVALGGEVFLETPSGNRIAWEDVD